MSDAQRLSAQLEAVIGPGPLASYLGVLRDLVADDLAEVRLVRLRDTVRVEPTRRFDVKLPRVA